MSSSGSLRSNVAMRAEQMEARGLTFSGDLGLSSQCFELRMTVLGLGFSAMRLTENSGHQHAFAKCLRFRDPPPLSLQPKPAIRNQATRDPMPLHGSGVRDP